MTLRQKNVSFDKIWPSLEQDLSSICKHKDLDRISAMQVFNNIYDLCIAKPEPHTERLVRSIESLLQEHTKQVLDTLLKNVDTIINVYADEWKKYETASNWIHQVCGYLNKLLVATKVDPDEVSNYMAYFLQHKMTVEAMALYTWKLGIIDHLKMKQDDILMKRVFDAIERDRNGETAYSADNVKTVVMSLLHCDKYSIDYPKKLYTDEFETMHINLTRDYYRTESQILIAKHSVKEYLEIVWRRLDEETMRCLKFCDETSAPKIIKECDQALIQGPSEKIYPEFKAFIEEENIEVMKSFYLTMSRLRDGILPLVKDFEECVSIGGNREIKSINVKDNKLLIEAIMKIYKKYSRIVKSAFDDNPQFIAAVDKALRNVVNNSALNFNISETLAKYSDMFLRRTGNSNRQSTNIDDQIDSVIVIFKYVDDKDIFQKFYSRFLARRLIYGTSISLDVEENVISRLKAVCGMEFTSKLQRMFQDVSISTDLSTEFQTRFDSINVHVLVLTAGAWPLSASNHAEFLAPRAFETPSVLFSNFYCKKFNGRRLFWMHHLSRTDVKCYAFDKRYEINMSLYQAAILLEFNTTDELTLDYIEQSLKLPKAEVQKALQPLQDISLIKTNENKSISLNHQFTRPSKKIRIKLSQSVNSAQESNAESESTRKNIEEDRRLFLQAAIVRIMKSKRKLNHKELVENVFLLSKDRFVPSAVIVKKCLEQLMDKQYIERNESLDEYVYLA